MPHIEVRDVSHTYDTPAGRVVGLAGASFDIEQSEFVCLVGPSGCGKSTLLNIIAGFLAPTAGELRIGGSDPMVAGLIPAIIDRISRHHPRVAFRVIHGGSDPQMFQALRQRDLDIFVSRMSGQAIDDDLNVEILFNEPLLIATGQQNPWARRRRIELRQIVDEPWVLPRPETLVGSLVANMFRANGCELPRNTVLGNSMLLNHALLATGRYFTVYSKSFLQLSAKTLGIKVLPIRLKVLSTPAAVVTLKNRTASPIAKLFVAHAREIGRSFSKAT